MRPASSTLTLRRLQAGDLPATLRLTQSQQWPHRLDDWEFHFRIGRGWCVCDADENVIGSALWWAYGTSLGSIGLVVVDNASQGQGVGRRLMNAIFDEAGGRTLQLNATAAGLRLYQQCGFTPVGSIEQRQANPAHRTVPPLPAGLRLTAAGNTQFDELARLDQQATGADRRVLLEALLDAGQTVVARRDDRVVGYAIARSAGLGTVVGPVVADSQATAQALIANRIAAGSGFMRVDIPASANELSQWLEGIGLPCVTRVTTMVRGPRIAPAGEAAVFGLASQALG
jgi:ribosomal protein S18 acetylase RimI-like enzyme